jgi:anti-sigma regulatory factor (Ser/Thr protein kinase)
MVTLKGLFTDVDGELEIRLLDNNHVFISLPNKLGYERIARACSASFAEIVGFPRDRIEDLKTAVAEACINAMQHGNKGRSDAREEAWRRFRGCQI